MRIRLSQVLHKHLIHKKSVKIKRQMSLHKKFEKFIFVFSVAIDFTTCSNNRFKYEVPVPTIMSCQNLFLVKSKPKQRMFISIFYFDLQCGLDF